MTNNNIHRKRNTVSLFGDVSCDPFTESDDKEERQYLLDTCIEALSGKQRLIVETYVSSSVTTFVHVSTTLGMPISTVKYHFYHACDKMRQVAKKTLKQVDG